MAKSCGEFGEKNFQWKGGRRVTGRGYVFICTPHHPRTNSTGGVAEHVLVCERALGKFLPPGAIPHHVNGNPGDNANNNLVICQNEAYHQLIHKRMRALEACGHANWGKCQFCKQWDEPDNLVWRPHNSSTFHRDCYNKFAANRRKIRIALNSPTAC
jgi:hypothetical protein